MQFLIKKKKNENAHFIINIFSYYLLNTNTNTTNSTNTNLYIHIQLFAISLYEIAVI